MVLFDYDKILKCKFLLQAGSSSLNTSVSAVFNQYRCNLLNNFLDAFDKKTKHLPADLVLPVTVYIPLPGSKVGEVFFDMSMPSTSFFFNKLFKSSLYNDFGLVFLELSLLKVFKVALLRSYDIKYRVFNLQSLYNNFFVYPNSLKSYSSHFPRKLFFFSLFFIKALDNLYYYRLSLSKPFLRFFSS